MRNFLSLIFLMAILESGCATSGSRFDSTKIDQIQVCKTNNSDLVQLFGEPFQRGGTSTYRTMVWHYAKVSFGSQENNYLIVYIDQKGRVIEYKLNPTSVLLTDDLAGGLPSGVLNKCEKESGIK